VTFSGNTAGINGGAMISSESSPTITNSIFWGNGSNQLDFFNHSYPIVTYSVIEGGFTGGTNIITADPVLGSLADNGGFTQTHALGDASPAIDAADPASCPAFDQRFYYRPIDGNGSGSAVCDMGAYEYGSYEVVFSITLESVGEGTVTIDPVQDTYHYGDEVTLTPNADPGWSFTSWSGDASGTLNPLLFTITDDTSITANFTQDEHTLSVAVDPLEKGTVTIDPVKDTFHYGDEVTLIPTAIPGWSFSSWSGDASGTLTPLLFKITDDTSITANFTQDEHTLSVVVDPLEKGTVTIDPIKDTYHYGDEVTLIPTAIPGWNFSSWSGDASGTDKFLTVTIMSDTNIIANFTQNIFNIFLPLILK